MCVVLQVYSNGLSEVILGRAIKQLKLPREELVIMTKARPPRSLLGPTGPDPAHRCYPSWQK